jgi:hypothetical protein
MTTFRIILELQHDVLTDLELVASLVRQGKIENNRFTNVRVVSAEIL